MAAKNPYEAPKAASATTKVPSRRRGVLLTIFLVWASITSVSTLVVMFLGWEQLQAAYPQWAALALAVIAGVRPVVTVGLWFWSRMAVVLYIVLSGIAMSVSVAVGQPRALVALVGAALLILLFRKHWAHMPWLLANNSSKPTPLRGAA